ncbi:serine/threonine-protein kinase [Rhodococcus erythropolis]
MKRIGMYVVERTLGEGGMGTVHLARSRGGRAVAVKVARPELAADPAFRERFRAEVDAARKVGGFHTAPVVDADPDADPPWLATAYIPGPTLSVLLAEQGPMGEHRLRQLGAALAEALQAIHACGLVHRDLKPGNIIMAEDGPRVLDFGIARAVESTRLTATGAAFGTPGYLAPEQALGEEVTGAADVFALGAVLVAAAGGSAFGTGTPMAMMYRSVHQTADLSSVPDGLRGVVQACLAKRTSDRPTPRELLDLLMPMGYEPTMRMPEPDNSERREAHRRERGHDVRASEDGSPTARTQEPGSFDAPTADAPGDQPPRNRVEAPVFSIDDGLSGLKIDATGLRFSLFGREAGKKAWDQIGAIEYSTTKRGKCLRVTVMLYDNTSATIEVKAGRRAQLDEWIEQLDNALDFHFPE